MNQEIRSFLQYIETVCDKELYELIERDLIDVYREGGIRNLRKWIDKALPSFEACKSESGEPLYKLVLLSVGDVNIQLMRVPVEKEA